MGNNWDELDDEKIKIRNGRCVMNALASYKNGIIADELLQYFIASTGESHDLVSIELNRVLDTGVANGFLVRNDNKYALPYLENIIHAVDCDDRGESKDDKKPDPAENRQGFTIETDLDDITIQLGQVDIEMKDESSLGECDPSTSTGKRKRSGTPIAINPRQPKKVRITSFRVPGIPVPDSIKSNENLYPKQFRKNFKLKIQPTEASLELKIGEKSELTIRRPQRYPDAK